MGGTAAVLAAILLAVVLVPRQPGTAPETLVALSVQRSGSTAEVTSAPAEAALRLSVDVTELPQMAQYRLEIVDGRGARVGQAIVPRTGRTLAWSSPKLAAGSYWVRVYDAGGKGPLLREYALRAE